MEDRVVLTAGPVGPAFVVNAVHSTLQYQADIASDQAGRFVVTWTSQGQDGSGDGIYARVFAPDGAALTGEFQVNQFTQNAQTTPAVAMAANGDFVIAWQSSPQGGIMARQYDASGTPKAGEFLALGQFTFSPGIAADAAGDFVVTGETNNGAVDGTESFAQRFSAAGAAQGAVFRVNLATTGNQSQPAPAMDATGNFAVTWYTGTNLFVRRFNAAGSPLSGDVQVNGTSPVAASPGQSIAMDDAGNFIVAWADGQEISAQRYGPTGATLGANFVVNAETNGAQVRPTAGMSRNGRSVVTWSDGANAFGQVFDAAGTRAGGTFKVFPTAAGAFNPNAVTIADNGNLVATWEGQDDPNSSSRGIFARRFDQFVNPASVGDKVWNDANGNGILDGAEAGTNGVTVTLFTAADGLIDVATTAGGGAYRFDGLRPGQSYYLQFSRPNNLVFTQPDQGANDTLDSDVDPITGLTAPFVVAAGIFDATRDAGLTAPGTITGTLFNDPDSDGLRSGSEAALSRWIAYVDLNRNGQRDPNEAFAFTDATGKYTISGLSPGVYAVLADLQAGWLRTGATASATVTPAKTTTVAPVGVRTSVVPKLSGPESVEFRVNATTVDRQIVPAVATNADGSLVITWVSNLQDGSGLGVFAQRYGADGAPVGPEFPVNQTTAGSQADPAIAVDAAGNFTVVWTSNQDGTPDVFMRSFDAAGVPRGDERKVNAFVTNSQFTPSIASDAAGDLLVAWASIGQDGDGSGIYAQRFDPLGIAVGPTFQVNASPTYDQMNPAVALNPTGQSVIVWDSFFGSPGQNIQGRLYDAAGAPVGAEFRVNDTPGSQAYPSAAMFPDGRFVVAWDGFGQDNSGRAALVKRFKANGAPEGQEVIANAYINLDQTSASVAVDADGNFAVVWQSATKDGSVAIGLQRYDAAGRAYGIELQPNTFTAGDQVTPAIAMNASGDFVVAWSSNGQDGSAEGIYAQRYSRTSNPASVGDFVWNDVDGDGLQDATEAGADNVTVGLYNAAGMLVDSAITANGGKYRFDGVKAGSYFVQLTPVTLLGTLPNRGANAQLDSDVGSFTLRSSVFTLAAGQTDLTRDAGLVLASTIAGTIYNDADGNADRGAVETGLAGWKVYVDLNANGQPDAGEPSATSDASGRYTIGGLPPGQYTLRVVSQPLWAQTTPPAGTLVNLPVNYALKGVDLGFAFPSPARVARTWGAQVRVNTSTSSFQVDPSVASDAGGNYVVVWRSNHADSAGDIFAQRYDALDRPRGGEFRVNELATGGQVTPSVAMSAAGDFVVVWQSASGDGDGTAIVGRRFNAAGVAQGGDFVVNSTPTGNQNGPVVAADAAGDFAVAWHTNTGGATPVDEVQARVFQASGSPVGPDFVVSDLGFAATDKPAIAMRGTTGEFVVAFAQTGKDGSGSGVFAQRYDPTGAAVGTIVPVNATTAGDQVSPALAFDAAGGFVVAWQAREQTGDSWDIIARRFDPAAAPLGPEFQANLYASGDQRAPAVVVEPSGSFVVGWSSTPSGYASPVATGGPGNYAARFDAAGNRVGGEFRLDAGTAGGTLDTAPVLAINTSAAFIAVHAGSEVYAQRFEQFTSPASIGGTVWDDADGDGVRDVGEAGRDNVTVRAYTADGLLIDSVKTAGGGLYRFDLLKPGLTYALEFVLPAGAVFTRQDQGADARDSDVDVVTGRIPATPLGPNQVELTRDAGLVAPGTISGTVFNDLDQDGLQTPGEPGVPSWQVFLDVNGDGQLGAGETAVPVNAGGGYQFTGLSPGAYRVALVPQARWTTTGPVDAGNVTLLAGQNRAGVDLGVRTGAATAVIGPVGGETALTPAASLLQFDYGAVAMDAAGNFVVVWQTRDGGGTDYHIRAQRFAADGTQLGASFLVHTDSLYAHVSPAVAMNAAGQFVVAWKYSDSLGQVTGLYVRKFAADGTPAAAQVKVNTGPSFANEAIAIDDAGNFVIAWESSGQDGSGLGVYARRFDSSSAPAGSEFLVNANKTAGDQAQPRVAMTSSGAFNIGWVDGAIGNENVFVQRYSPTGVALDPPIQVNVAAQSSPGIALATAGDGDFVVAYGGTDAGQTGLLLRRFDALGHPQGLPVAIAPGASSVSITMDAADNYTVVYSAADENGSGVFARRFNAAGTPQGSEFRVNTATKGNQSVQGIAGNSLGDSVVVWVGSLPVTTAPDFFFQRLAATSNPGVVSGTVWADLNGDGIRQAGEPGIDGISVQFSNAFGAPAGTAVTSGGGLYRFPALLPGQDYTVLISSPTARVPSPRGRGADPTLDSDVFIDGAARVNVPAGAAARVDAGFTVPSSLAGVVFNDVNSDGIQQPGEIPLPGFIVYLDVDADGLLDPSEPTATTAANGSYTLSNLTNGSYALAIVSQDAWVSTGPALPRTITLLPAQNLTGIAIPLHTSAPTTQGVPMAPAAAIVGAASLYGTGTAMDAAGNYVVAWVGTDTDSTLGIVARRFSATGAPLGPEFRVNTTVVSQQTNPVVAMDAAGAFVIAWQDDGNGQFIAAQRYNAAGQKQGGELRVSTIYGNWQAPHIAMRNDGSFVISWSGVEGGPYGTRDVYVQRYGPSGSPSGANTRVNTVTDQNQDLAGMGMDAAGNVLILWNSTTDGNPVFELGIYGQRYNAAGAPIGGQTFIEQTPGIYGGATLSPEGGLVIAEVGVQVKRFNPAGVPQGAPLTVGDASDQRVRPAVAVDPQGNIIVAYAAYRGGWGVYVRRLNAAGVPQGAEIRIDPGYGTGTDTGAVQQISIAANALGFVVAWGGPAVRAFRTAQAGDADGDGAVGFSDLVKVAQNYGATQAAFADGDFNGDGVVDFVDLVAVAQKYGTAAPYAPPVAPALQTPPAASLFASATEEESAPKKVNKPLFSTTRVKAVPVTRPVPPKPQLSNRAKAQASSIR